MSIMTTSEEHIKSRIDKCQIFIDVLDLITNGVCITDIDGKILHVNKAFCETCKYSKEELIGQNPRLLKSGIHSKEFYQKMWDTVKSGNAWSGSIINQDKNGNMYTDRIIIAPMKYEGEIAYFVCTRHNVDNASDEMLEKLEQISAKLKSQFSKKEDE